MKKFIYLFLAYSLFASSCSCKKEEKKVDNRKDITFETVKVVKKDKIKEEKKEQENLKKENFIFLPSNTGEIIEHDYYTLSYSEEHEQAEWVAYELHERYTNGKSKRKDNFREDDLINTGSASLADYKASGYDRGHLLPAADMKFSDKAMSQTFFMSNMSPQHPKLNRVRWKQLEEQVRDWVEKDKHYYVITGPVLTNVSKKKLGENEVSIPTQYYKIIFDYTEPSIKMIGFLMPNEECPKDVIDYAVSIDSIEKVTGLDFFLDLPDTMEEELESVVDAKKWK